MNMTSTVKMNRQDETKKAMGAVTNFMGGISYTVNALDRMKLITASSIFGEPQYYRKGKFAEATCVKDAGFIIDAIFAKYMLEEMDVYKGMNTSDIMEDAIDKALAVDFEETLKWAVQLRTEYNMRLNPQIIMVRASLSEGRKAFTEKNGGKFDEYEQKVMIRPDDVISQITYYLFLNGSKKNAPNLLKRSWKKNIEKMSKYNVYKYRNHGIGLIDSVRICHASSPVIDELMTTGTVTGSEDENILTWETCRSAGDSWKTILGKVKMGHMALLRNLRGILNECGADYTFMADVLTTLKKGVKTGKQFPYRYLSAYRNVNGDTQTKDALEECMDIACENLPKLAGNNAFLSDNSGSAWGSLTSEYGSVVCAEINNLSCVIGAVNSDKGTVFTFGNRLIKHEISKRNGILAQTKEINKDVVGRATENGIWLFFKDAIEKKIKYDNIFIYSDMQAGHGGLYGMEKSIEEYRNKGFSCRGTYIDVAKLADEYRKTVNPKVNIFSVQTAGYDNVVLPENGYRTAIMYGWTGKELIYADAVNKLWDEIDAKRQ